MLEEVKKVIIKGQEYSIDDPNVKEDCFIEGQYIYEPNYEHFNYFIFNSFERGKFKTKKGYSTKHPGTVGSIVVKTMAQSSVSIYFKSRQEKDLFIQEYNLLYNENNGYYHFEHEFEIFNRRKPRSFDYTRRLYTPEDIGYYIKLDENSKKTTEYKELVSFIKQKNAKYGMDSFTFLETEGIRHTFGVEIETISGSFNDEEVCELNLKAVHDGSLRDPDGSGPWGKEYVTGVLKGDSGFKHLQEIVKTISGKCKIDQRASVHVHIGSLKWNSEEIVLAYLLGEILEDELFAMMPKSRAENEYCKKLKPLSIRNKALLKISKDKKSYRKVIDKLYIEIFKEVAKVNKPSREFNKRSGHPKGQHGGYDRQTDHRYKWLNFTNIMFNQRGNMDYKKIRNWIKICMAFVEFVHNNKKSIISRTHNGQSITIETILRAAYPKTADYLVSYVKNRKELFSEESNQTVDYTESCNNEYANKKELIRCV